MSNLHPIFENVLVVHADQLAQLNRALRKADARRFTGEPVTGFGALAAPTPSLHERMASDIAALAAEADNLDTCDYIGYGAVREHLEAAIAALELCGGQAVVDRRAQRTERQPA